MSTSTPPRGCDEQNLGGVRQTLPCQAFPITLRACRSCRQWQESDQPMISDSGGRTSSKPHAAPVAPASKRDCPPQHTARTGILVLHVSQQEYIIVAAGNILAATFPATPARQSPYSDLVLYSDNDSNRSHRGCTAEDLGTPRDTAKSLRQRCVGGRTTWSEGLRVTDGLSMEERPIQT